jgi:hypothetical protein
VSFGAGPPAGQRTLLSFGARPGREPFVSFGAGPGREPFRRNLSFRARRQGSGPHSFRARRQGSGPLTAGERAPDRRQGSGPHSFRARRQGSGPLTAGERAPFFSRPKAGQRTLDGRAAGPFILFHFNREEAEARELPSARSPGLFDLILVRQSAKHSHEIIIVILRKVSVIGLQVCLLDADSLGLDVRRADNVQDRWRWRACLSCCGSSDLADNVRDRWR